MARSEDQYVRTWALALGARENRYKTLQCAAGPKKWRKHSFSLVFEVPEAHGKAHNEKHMEHDGRTRRTLSTLDPNFDGYVTTM